MSIAGYGDEATWGPCLNNPLDPRTPEREESEWTRDELIEEFVQMPAEERFDMVEDLQERVRVLEVCVKEADKVFAAQDAWPTVGWTLVQYQAMRKLAGEIK